MSTLSAREALAELVACKDLKERANALHFAGPLSSEGEQWEAVYNTLRREYICRQPLAWEAARRVLAEPPEPTSNSAPSGSSATQGENDDDESDSGRARRLAGEGNDDQPRAGRATGPRGPARDDRATEDDSGLLRARAHGDLRQGDAERVAGQAIGREQKPIGEVRDDPDDYGSYVDWYDEGPPVGTKLYASPPEPASPQTEGQP